MARKALLQRLWRRVHPDLFQRHPHAQGVNERSMQELHAFLEVASSPAPRPHAATVDFRFFVHRTAAPPHDVSAAALREISLQWETPAARGAAPHPRRSGEVWESSADRCVAALVAQAELTEREDAADEEEDEAAAHAAPRLVRRPIPPSLQPDAHRHNAMVRLAAAAASRCKGSGARPHRPPAAPDAAVEAAAAAAAGVSVHTALSLNESLLFFHGLTESEKAPPADWDARVRLRSLLPLVSATLADEHGPILVHSSVTPHPHAPDGFASLPLGFDLPTLEASLSAAATSPARAAAEQRRASAQLALRLRGKLRGAMGCEAVEVCEQSASQDVCTLLGELLPRASELRACLEGPWSGLWLELSTRGEGGGQEGAAPACELFGSEHGGGLLLLHGTHAASQVPHFVRQSWRQLRQAQARHALLLELREQLGCRDVRTSGGVGAFASHVESLHELLAQLRMQPWRAPPREVLETVDIHIGAPSKEAALPSQSRKARVLLPDTFEPDLALDCLHQATQAAQSRKKKSRRK
ncbi:hypothetical protein AB1Y20_022134 [Prymnesium parvum]|uniref:DUF4460 domain-containing protein n=1 Tax=Prymnesium parvum TaxID=97485 RepID=A0AB34JHX6_PRYPA